MQMRAGGHAGAAHIANDCALRHALAGVDAGKARHVAIERALAGTMIENDHVAVATLLSHKFHLGITGCLDGGAGAGGVIHALVHAEGA